MGAHIYGAGQLQHMLQSAGMVIVAMTQKYSAHAGKIFFQAGGIMDDGVALTGVKQKTFTVPFDQHGKAVLAQHADRMGLVQ